jgi:hypothetical protein
VADTAIPELGELALDPDTAPARVLLRDLENEVTNRRIDPRPSRPTDLAVRPLLPDELAVPAKERRRRDQKAGPSVARDQPTCRAEQDSVDGPELGWAGLPPKDSELMAEDEDLEILGTVVGTRINEETGERPND